MVILKTQPNPPLETIYEESGSFASTVNIQHQPARPTGTINGLISARSIPSVDFERQRGNVKQHRPPIEVRYRDGSKRYIPPSSEAAMIMNRRKLSNSSQNSLSSKTMPNSSYQQIFNSNLNQTRPPVVLTIITADDLQQAGVTPTYSSSPDESVRSISTSIQSQSTLSSDSSKARKHLNKVSFAPLPMTPTHSSIHSVSNHSTPNPRSSSSLSQQSQEQQVAANPHQISAPSQSFPHQLPPVPSPKTTNSSLQIALLNEKIDRNISLKSNLPNLISSSNQTVKTTTALIGGGTHSAFRPFLKPMHFNQNTFPITTRKPFTINGNPYKPSQQQQRQMLPYAQIYHQKYPSNLTQVSFQSTSAPSKAVIPKQSSNFKSLTQTVNSNSLSLLQNSSNYGQRSIPVPISTNKNSLGLSNILNISSSSGQNLSVTLSPDLNWYNITSNDVNDIPHLAKRYSGIPLRITLPVVTPTHNQKLVMTHNTALETRLLNAGLSPETVALYERILDIAGNRQIPILSPPTLIDSNSYTSLE